MNQKYFFSGILLVAVLLWSCNSYEETFSGSTQDERVQFAIAEISNAVLENQAAGKGSVNFSISKDVQNEAEGFQILRMEGNHFEILATNPAGAMYGGLELAEQARLYGWDGIKPMKRTPHMKMRGVKFNIPLDARTPSYSDASDAGQKNIETVWDFSFWKSYIDHLARYRFNYISLWSLHPFPSLVKVPRYPDVALDDVWKSSVEWEENYHLHGTGLDAPEILKDPEIIKRISMEEKIDFWKKVMAYGKERNIDFYFITWNIFTNGTFGQYGITDDSKNETTRDYFKESVRQLFITYPDLKGIGLATGENMPGLSAEEKEEWAYNTYASGLLEVAKEMPDRDFTFIHRQHQSGAKDILARFKPLIDQNNIDFLFCFKYAKAHVYSAVKQPYHHRYVDDIRGQETLWGLRNDDTYYFRWGAPDFVRTFIKNIPDGDMTKGIYFGSDQWIWGREFLTRGNNEDRQLEIEKHWYQWMLWGRLSYDPEVSNDRFIDIIQSRYPSVSAEELFSAWQMASMIYPITTGFHWGALDFQWYIEGCQSRPGPANNETGFHDVNRFISLPPHPLSGYQSIPDFVKNGKRKDLLTPIEVSGLLHQQTDSAMIKLSEMTGGNSSELKATLEDIKTISYLGKYYAYKIAGSTYTAIYRDTGDRKFQEKAKKELIKALEYWKGYVEMASKNNMNPLWTNRVGYVDWARKTEWVEKDIVICCPKDIR